MPWYSVTRSGGPQPGTGSVKETEKELDPKTTAIATVPLSETLALEWGCAISSAFLVAPFISIIDKAIFANASGVQPLGAGIVGGFKTLLTKPAYFMKQPAFLLIWGVYSGTLRMLIKAMNYKDIVANSIEAVCNSLNVSYFYPKFVGASAANVSLSVLKDLYFTRAFGKTTTASPNPTATATTAAKPPATPRPVPFRSYSLYTIRDSMTIFASFNLPQIVSANLVESFGMKSRSAEFAAQLVTPCAVQLVSTPLHLLGMDFYNSPKANVGERAAFVGREYLGTTLARMGRIFPAYGIGGVVNKQLRYQSKEFLNARHNVSSA
ncbi:hypothetical protein HDU67_005909 [Dinochytrium kinnereticum]|nr:hypothetical protein HDU67_005909 [Dinochytrium kinnereticum]